MSSVEKNGRSAPPDVQVPQQERAIRETDQIVDEMLGDLYKPECILAQSVEVSGNGEYTITFEFPVYERTINPLDHVSMSQMHEAVLEAAYCVIGDHIKNQKVELPIDFEKFKASKLDAIYAQESFTFKKMLKAGEPAELTCKVSRVMDVTYGREFHGVVLEFDGFMKGSATCLLPK